MGHFGILRPTSNGKTFPRLPVSFRIFVTVSHDRNTKLLPLSCHHILCKLSQGATRKQDNNLGPVHVFDCFRLVTFFSLEAGGGGPRQLTPHLSDGPSRSQRVYDSFMSPACGQRLQRSLVLKRHMHECDACLTNCMDVGEHWACSKCCHDVFLQPSGRGGQLRHWFDTHPGTELVRYWPRCFAEV